MTERAPVDAWTVGHVAVGAIYGALGLSPWQALLASAAFEVVEQVFVDESGPNIAVDIAANMLGYAVARIVLR